jgi:hypothetical protein
MPEPDFVDRERRILLGAGASSILGAAELKQKLSLAP